MRRTDREITDFNLIEKFIRKEEILRIAFYDEGDIYIVPVNYGYCNVENKYIFYFHGAKAGRKYELAKKKPTVGFEIDGNYKLLEGDIACQFSAKFQSVIGTGKLSLLETDREKIEGLDFIMQQINYCKENKYSDEMIKAVAVFKLVVDKISCKAKDIGEDY